MYFHFLTRMYVKFLVRELAPRGLKICQETRKVLFNTPKTEHIAHKMNRKKCSASTVKTSKRLKAPFSIY